MQVPVYKWAQLRDYQREILEKLPTVREAVLVVARRGAKTSTIANEYLIPQAMSRVINIVIIWPTKTQGYNNFWTMTDDYGHKFLDQIPPELVAGSSSTEQSMYVEFVNGSRITLLSAKDTEALRGANAKIYFFDEFVDIPKEALSVVRPITNRNNGQIIIASTPKFDGISGETFRRLYESAKKDPTKYAVYIDGSHFMTQNEMDRLRQDYIDQDGTDFKYRQEVLLDWGQSSDGSYYGDIIQNKLKDGTIGVYEYNPKHPVFTSWDLGRSDNLAILFWQWIDGRVYIIDSFITSKVGLDSVIPVLTKGKPYVYKWHFLPWDGVVHSANDNVNRIDFLMKNGIMNVSTLRRTGVTYGIGLVEKNLPKALINKAPNEKLIRDLSLYRRKKNPLTGDFDGPEHNSASHFADAVRYIWTAIDQNWVNGKFIGEDTISQETYEMDDVLTSFY